ncbi:YegP family protein [Polaromonas sp. AER18D-145]
MAQSETYTSKQSCEHSIDQLKRFAANAAIDDLS